MTFMSQKTFSRDYSLNSRTLKSTAERLELAVIEARRGGVTFRGRKLGAEAVINVEVKAFLELTLQERIELLSRFCPVIEAELDQEQADSPGIHTVGDYHFSEIADLTPVSPAKPKRQNKGTNPPKSPPRKT